MKEEEYEIGEIVWDVKDDVKNVRKIENKKVVDLNEKDRNILGESLYNSGIIYIKYPLYVPGEHYVKVGYEIEYVSYIELFMVIKEFYEENNNYEKLGDYVWFDYIEDDNRVFTLHLKTKTSEDVGEPTLYRRQLNHLNRLIKITDMWHSYIDTSPTGAGKTHVTCALAKHLGLDIILASPLAVLDKWKDVASQFGVKIFKSMTYDSIRGTVKNPPKNGLVIRTPNKIGFMTSEAIESAQLRSAQAVKKPSERKITQTAKPISSGSAFGVMCVDATHWMERSQQ